MKYLLALFFALSVWYNVNAKPIGTSIDYGNYQIQTFINENNTPHSYIIYYKINGKAVMYYEYHYSTGTTTVWTDDNYSSKYIDFEKYCKSEKVKKRIKSQFKLMKKFNSRF